MVRKALQPAALHSTDADTTIKMKTPSSHALSSLLARYHPSARETKEWGKNELHITPAYNDIIHLIQSWSFRHCVVNVCVCVWALRWHFTSNSFSHCSGYFGAMILRIYIRNSCILAGITQGWCASRPCRKLTLISAKQMCRFACMYHTINAWLDARWFWHAWENSWIQWIWIW